MADTLYKINYKADQQTDSEIIEIYAKYADLAAKANQLNISSAIGSSTQFTYFDANGIPHAGTDLSKYKSVKYSYDEGTAMATITFGDWKD